MMAKRKHIPLFDDQLEILELLTDQEVGQAVLAAMRFMRSGAEADLTGGAGGGLSDAPRPVRPEPKRRRRREKGRASPEKPRRNPGFRNRNPGIT